MYQRGHCKVGKWLASWRNFAGLEALINYAAQDAPFVGLGGLVHVGNRVVGRAGAGWSPWPRLAVQSTKLGQVCSASALRFSSLLCVRSYPVGHSHLTIRRP